MDNQVEEELNNSIKLFFWDPKVGCDSYRSEYQKYNQEQLLRDGQIVRYPRLLLIRRDLYFTLWKPLNQANSMPDYPYDGIPHFASVLLIRSACELLVRGLFSRNFDKPTDGDFNGFFNEYFNLQEIESKSLKLLRNSIVHDGYSLSVYEKENCSEVKYYFDIAKDGLERIHHLMRFGDLSISNKPTPNIVERLLYSDSQNTIGIQIADLYCYPVFHIFEYNKNPEDYWRFKDVTLPKLRRVDGKLIGYGLKIFSDQSKNGLN